MPGGILPPIAVIASWPAANYDNPVQRDWTLVIVTAVVSLLSLLTVSARLWARIALRTVGVDDWIIVTTMIPALGMSVSICLASRLYGFDRHVWDNSLVAAVRSRKLVMIIEALYVISAASIKISILLFYRRLVAGAFSGTFIWAIRATIFTVIAYAITFETTLIFGCRPTNAFWNEVNPFWRAANEGKYFCLDEVSTLYGANITSIVQDFLACGMPLLLFWKLQLPIRQKILLGTIFGVGFFVCIVGIVRIIYTENLYFNTYDATWASQPIWIWTAVEVHCGIMCASAPALKVFFKRYLSVSGSRDGNGDDRSPRYPEGARAGKGEGVGPSILSKGLKFVDISHDSGTGSEGSTYANGSSIVGYETTVFDEKTQVEGWGGNASGVSGEHAEIGGSDNSLFTAYPIETRIQSPGATQNPVPWPLPSPSLLPLPSPSPLPSPLPSPSPQRLRKEQYARYTPFSAV